MTSPVTGRVAAVCRSAIHGPGKEPRTAIRLLRGLGVEGDAHFGEKVQHLSRVRRNPDQPNLRQVHLIHEELFVELRARGFSVSAGMMGENITTRGLELLHLPVGTRLRIGGEAEIEITGLRNPCVQLEGVAPGLMEAVLDRTSDGELIRKAGVMAVVTGAGAVEPGHAIEVALPPLPHRPLQPV